VFVPGKPFQRILILRRRRSGALPFMGSSPWKVYGLARKIRQPERLLMKQLLMEQHALKKVNNCLNTNNTLS